MGWVNRLRNVFRKQRLSDEIDEEMAFHLEARAQDNLRRA